MEEIVLDLSYLSTGECIIAAFTASVAFTALVLSWCITFDEDCQKHKGTLLKSSLAAIVMTALTIAICLRWFYAYLVFLGVILLVPLATAIKDNNKIKF